MCQVDLEESDEVEATHWATTKHPQRSWRKQLDKLWGVVTTVENRATFHDPARCQRHNAYHHHSRLSHSCGLATWAVHMNCTWSAALMARHTKPWWT